jgi:KUP system potassium uptake protein
MVIPFVIVDMTFFSANFLNLFEGAWVPLTFGVVMAILIWTWRRGTAIPTLKTRREEIPLKDLIRSLKRSPPHAVKGTAVFLTSDPIFVPTALLRIACAWRRSAKNSPRSGCASATWRLRTRQGRWRWHANWVGSSTFFVSRRSLKPSAQSGMPLWQDRLFIAMSRLANDATDCFQIPTGTGGRGWNPGHH